MIGTETMIVIMTMTEIMIAISPARAPLKPFFWLEWGLLAYSTVELIIRRSLVRVQPPPDSMFEGDAGGRSVGSAGSTLRIPTGASALHLPRK